MQKYYKLTIGLLACVLGASLEGAVVLPRAVDQRSTPTTTRAAVAALKAEMRCCAVDCAALLRLFLVGRGDGFSSKHLPREFVHKLNSLLEKAAQSLCYTVAPEVDFTAAAQQVAKGLEIGAMDREFELCTASSCLPEIADMIERGQLATYPNPLPANVSRIRKEFRYDSIHPTQNILYIEFAGGVFIIPEVRDIEMGEKRLCNELVGRNIYICLSIHFEEFKKSLAQTKSSCKSFKNFLEKGIVKICSSFFIGSVRREFSEIHTIRNLFTKDFYCCILEEKALEGLVLKNEYLDGPYKSFSQACLETDCSLIIQALNKASGQKEDSYHFHPLYAIYDLSAKRFFVYEFNPLICALIQVPGVQKGEEIPGEPGCFRLARA